MTTGERQGLRGIDEAILEAASLAARRSGLSVSDWLHELIARQAAVEQPTLGRDRSAETNEDAIEAGTDEDSRVAHADLQARLDDIVERLWAEAGDRRDGAANSPQEIATTEDLSRDVDDVGETARTTVEDMNAGRGPNTLTSHANPVAEAVRCLEERLSLESDGSASGSHTKEATSQLCGAAAGGDLSTAVAEISARQRSIDDQADLSAIVRSQQQISESLNSLHDGLAALADQLAILVDPVQETPDTAPATDRLGAIEGEVIAIRRALEKAENPRVVAQLELRVAELVHTVEAVVAADNAASGPVASEAIGRLESQLDTILARIDVVLDRSNSKEPFEEIAAEIARTRQDISERDSSRAIEIKAQIASLASRLDAATDSARIESAVRELEQQVARLGSDLERARPQSVSLPDIEAQLLRLQDSLSANQLESVEAVRKAARDAAQEVAETARSEDIVNALKQDLGEIRRASWAADSRTQEALSSVQVTLGRVVAGLSRLDGERDGRTVVEHEVLRATGTDDARTPIPRAEAGLVAGRAHTREPDLVKPNLAALRELARSAARGGGDDATGRKADFIAAARRAAKAAAEEPALPTSRDVADGRPGTFSRISQALRNRRRTLLVLAAASVVAGSAGQMFREVRVTAVDERPETDVSMVDGAGRAVERSGVAVEPGPAQSDADKTDGPAARKPSTDDPTILAFTAPERIDSRFGDMPVAPPTKAFIRASLRARSLPLDEAIGSAELRKAAAAGNPHAAVEVAARYAEGRLVPRDLTTAAQWYEVAAEDGVAVAQNRLASLYQQGQGVAKNPAVAADWYRRAAEQGNTGAMHNLAVMLSSGTGGAPHYREAAHWFRAAADRGVEDSQYNLGVMYARGLGGDRDLVKSYKWFALAAANGDPEAAAHREEVAGALSPGDLAKARAIVEAWRPMPTHAAANALASLPATWSDSTHSLTAADRRSLVMKIQALLAEQGYDPGPADGLEGPHTLEAVRAFQRNIGMVETGTISSDVLAALADASG